MNCPACGSAAWSDAAKNCVRCRLRVAAAQTPASVSTGASPQGFCTSDAVAPEALQHTCLTHHWDRTCLACQAEGKNQPTFAGDDGTLEVIQSEPFDDYWAARGLMVLASQTQWTKAEVFAIAESAARDAWVCALHAKPESVQAPDVAEAHGQDETPDRRVRASSAGGEEK